MRRSHFLNVVNAPLVGLLFAGCVSPAPQATLAPTSAPAPATAATAAPSVSSTSSATASPAPTVQSSAPAGMIQLRLQPGSEARYRVREQLAGVSLPSDAIGRTTEARGAIVLDRSGAVIAEQSRFVVDLRTLRSDESRRDNFIQRNTLETSRFPTAEFVVREVKGLSLPLPASGEHSFELVGDLTVREITRPVTWRVSARFNGQEVAGTATTGVSFEDFNMDPPRVPIVLSVEDVIRLEMDFRASLDRAG